MPTGAASPSCGLGIRRAACYASRMSEQFPGPRNPATSVAESEDLLASDGRLLSEIIADSLASLWRFSWRAALFCVFIALAYLLPKAMSPIVAAIICVVIFLWTMILVGLWE